MLNVEVHDRAVRAALNGLAKSLGNLQPVLADVGEDIVQRARARFGSSTGPDGARWKDKKVKDGRPPLIGESGFLRSQIVSGAASNTLTVSATMGWSAPRHYPGATVHAGARERQPVPGRTGRGAGDPERMAGQPVALISGLRNCGSLLRL
jgi:hypothetical protein